MAIAFLFLGLFLFYQATQLSMRSLDGGPGPGLLPAGLGLLMALLSLRLVPSSWREHPRFGHVGRIGLMVATVTAYTLILERVGFLVASSLMMVVLMVAFNQRYRLPLAALGVAGTVLAYQLFYNTLKVQLPPDPWGLWR